MNENKKPVEVKQHVSAPSGARRAMVAAVLGVAGLGAPGTPTSVAETGTSNVNNSFTVEVPTVVREDLTTTNEGLVSAHLGSDVGSSSLNPAGRQELDNLVSKIAREAELNDGFSILKASVEGSASDDRGIGTADSYNEKLAQERSSAAASELANALAKAGLTVPAINQSGTEKILPLGSAPTELELSKDRGSDIGINYKTIETTPTYIPGMPNSVEFNTILLGEPCKYEAGKPPVALDGEKGYISDDVGYRRREKNPKSGAKRKPRAIEGSITTNSGAGHFLGYRGIEMSHRGTPPNPLEVSLNGTVGQGPNGTIWTFASPAVQRRGFVSPISDRPIGKLRDGHNPVTKRIKQPTSHNDGNRGPDINRGGRGSGPRVMRAARREEERRGGVTKGRGRQGGKGRASGSRNGSRK
jgi:hypothetical protein